MSYLTEIEPITSLKTRSAELIRRARRSRQPIVITQNGKATAVLQDIRSFEQQRETLLLLMLIAQGERELSAGKGTSHAKAKRQFVGLLRTL